MDAFINNCSAFILAGGENTRMPVLKAFIEVNGQTIIQRSINVLKQLFSDVAIVTNQPELYTYLTMPMLGDIYDSRGPMTGITTALLNSSHQWNFVSACDMPFIDTAVIQYMTSQRKGYDAVVPVVSGKVEPLFALYSKRLLPSMEKSLLQNKKSLRDFLNNKRVKYITTSEVRKFDNVDISFINLNTPRDIALYLKPEDRLRFKRKAGRRGKCLDQPS